ncbi:MAG: sigma-70 family RNA polymerase sigma factor [Gemmataceae bacterium]|nr:sigma-70 family RNA polymerase sigma factor [Gemmataceae bacterium]
MEEEDDHLIARSANGDSTSFNLLFHKYAKVAFQAAIRCGLDEASAEDVSQETMMNLWVGSSHLSELRNIAGWVYRVASRNAVNVLRKRKERGIDDDTLAHVPDNSPNEAEVEEDYEGLRICLGELGKLDIKALEIVKLVCLQEKSVVEVAKTRGVTPNALYIILSRARNNLRECLQHRSGARVPSWSRASGAKAGGP